MAKSKLVKQCQTCGSIEGVEYVEIEKVNQLICRDCFSLWQTLSPKFWSLVQDIYEYGFSQGVHSGRDFGR